MLVETMVEQMATTRYIKPVPLRAATGLTAETYRQMQSDFLPVPLLTLHSPVPELMAAVWSSLRECLLAGHVDRARKEVVAATVSQLNACPFCVDAHTLLLRASAEDAAADAIVRGDPDGIVEPRLRELAQWVVASRTPNVAGAPPLTAEEAPEIVGTALTFHYINRMVNVFLGDTLLPVPVALRGVAGRVVAATAGKRMVRRLEPARSLRLVAAAAVPDDLAWALESPAVASALASLVAAVEALGAQAVPGEVRELLAARLAVWDGTDPGLSRSWVEAAAAAVRAEHRAAARLVLLTAFAAYQVDDAVVAEFREHYPADTQLIAVTAWASLRAARRAVAPLAAPFIPVGRN